MSDELAKFLAARLDEDERQAQEMKHVTVPGEEVYSCAGSRTEPYGDLEWGEDACDCFLAQRKSRALRDLAGKRAILTEWKAVRKLQGLIDAAKDTPSDRYRDWVLRHLATAYSDHPDYQQEWKP